MTLETNKKFQSVLVVCPEFPWPENHGGRVDMMTSINQLNEIYNKVDLLYVDRSPARKTDLAKFISKTRGSVYFCKRTNSPLDFIGLLPYQVKSRSNLKTVKINDSYDLIFVISDYSYFITDNKNVFGNAEIKIFRSQNDECLYFFELAKTQSFLKLKFYYLLSESFKFFFLKWFIRDRFSSYWFISKDECESSDLVPTEWVPPSIVAKKLKPITEASKKICFVGSLFMDNNLEGLKWYLDKIHLGILENNPDYTLIVAGNPRDQNVDWIQSYPSVDLHLLPSDEELNEIYANSSIFISPMFHGAGVKLKTVNAIINGLAVVGTTVGCEGMGFQNEKHAFITNKDERFEYYINLLMNDEMVRKKMILSAQNYIQKEFDLNYENLIQKL